jgi:hypothetical protein
MVFLRSRCAWRFESYHLFPEACIRTRFPHESSFDSVKVDRPSVAIDPIRPDEHGGPAFFGHYPVVLVPVVMLAAGSGEDLATELP